MSYNNHVNLHLSFVQMSIGVWPGFPTVNPGTFKAAVLQMLKKNKNKK